jgi:hypothetical protein
MRSRDRDRKPLVAQLVGHVEPVAHAPRDSRQPETGDDPEGEHRQWAPGRRQLTCPEHVAEGYPGPADESPRQETPPNAAISGGGGEAAPIPPSGASYDAGSAAVCSRRSSTRRGGCG